MKILQGQTFMIFLKYFCFPIILYEILIIKIVRYIKNILKFRSRLLYYEDLNIFFNDRIKTTRLEFRWDYNKFTETKTNNKIEYLFRKELFIHENSILPKKLFLNITFFFLRILSLLQWNANVYTQIFIGVARNSLA